MGTAPKVGHRARLPAARPVLLQLLLLVLVVLVFNRLHHALGKDAAAATRNAEALQALERSLRSDIELGVNRWLVEHEALLTPAALFYRSYYVVLLAVLLWVLLRHADVHAHVRDTLIAMAGLALLVFWALPMSPPRFALAGVVDVVAEYAPFARRSPPGANVFSAMPSLHVGWSALAAYAAWLVLRGRYPRAALLVWAFPALMVAVVIATGNHYVLDIVGSALLLAAAIGAARGWARLRGSLAR